MLRYLFLIIGLFLKFSLLAQHLWPSSSERQKHILDRWAIIYGLDVKDALSMVNSKQIIAQAMHLDSTINIESRNLWELRSMVTLHNLGFNQDVVYEPRSLSSSPWPINSRRPVLKNFYRTPAHFFEVNTRDFQLRVNPIITGLLGKSSTGSTFLNQRGFWVAGQVDQKLFFQMQVQESQAQPAPYVSQLINSQRSYPGEGLYKSYRSDFWGVNNGYDYLNAQGFLGFQASKHFQLQLGHGRQFIGHGLRSLLLSDFSNNYLYLRFNTKVWKFHYQNLWAELTPSSPNSTPGDHILPKKYFAAHYLSFKPVKALEIGLFETVVFARDKQFELNYLNPLILYRSVEHALGSPDNVLIGLDIAWIPLRKTTIYSQLILDEFKLNELLDQTGWWANKYGIQAGIKFYDLPIPHLDIQLEANVVRPFTYSHTDSISNYSHYLYPLAHPLGANFKEIITRMQYVPAPRWRIQWDQARIIQGRNDGRINYGGNILWPNSTRLAEYGHKIGQGRATTVWWNQIQVDYELFPQCFLFANGLWRKENDQGNFLMQAGISLNLEPRKYIF